jgi:DNA repair exonuclease SbcCD nuclease subunit
MVVISNPTVRILFLADTHLGYDLPFRPRIKRRRRGPDFFANFERSLNFALRHRVDAIVHGGDLLYRSQVPPRLVDMAIAPLKRLADAGIPVFLVPGNHERSVIPHRHLAVHPHIYIFDRPRTYTVRLGGLRFAVAGFPFIRNHIRRNFPKILVQSGWNRSRADQYLLCIHQSVEGATIGPVDYTFRYAADVIKLSDIPQEFAAVLSGHIHRRQVLTVNLQGASLSTPVFYSGSIERTSFAEKDERKGFFVLDFSSTHRCAALKRWFFHDLPTRPMIQLDVTAARMGPAAMCDWIEATLAELPLDSVVKIRVYGKIHEDVRSVLTAGSLRTLAPATQNVSAFAVEAGWR